MVSLFKCLGLGLVLVAASVGVHAQQSDADVVLRNIMTRSSVRKFQDKPVEAAKQEKILRAAMASPSSRNMQPWHFVVLNDRKSIDHLAEAMRGNEMIKGAALVIVSCGDTIRMQEGQARDFWVEDLSASSENILLSAHALGLGAVWTSVYPILGKSKAYAKALGLPANLVPFNCILIGYPAGKPQPQDKWDSSKVTYYKLPEQ